jgi:predicted dehydrogenase
MANSRRQFLQTTVLGVGAWFLPAYASSAEDVDKILQQAQQKMTGPRFNMSGYAAPKLDVVRIGFIGLGNRGSGAVERMTRIEGVKINALCDLRPAQVEKARKLVEASGHKPALYSGGPEEWKKLAERDDLDLVYILTPWAWHTPMAVFAMEHGKHVCVEVPAAKTIEEAWQLVKTSEQTRKHCMMVENCCYDASELLTLNMARQGFFGEIVHCEGGYLHNLQDLMFSKEHFYQMWELEEASKRVGNLYPTHGLGPLCQLLNINRGDKMEYLVSMSSNDFITGPLAERLAATDPFYKQYAGRKYNGTMNTSTIRTSKGKTIMVQFDVSSPRPYSRIQLVTGTKGSGLKYPEPARYATGHEWLKPEEYKALEEKYMPPILKKIGGLAKGIGDHGGMDFIMDWRTIDCLRNGLPLDQNVYDAALWSSVAPLSVWSVANHSNSIDVPDYTGGNWTTNVPVDISLSTGGTTKVLGTDGSAAVAAGLITGGVVAEPGKRMGIIGLDTSHSTEFTAVLNGSMPDPAYEGYKIVAAYPRWSQDIQSSAERIPAYTQEVKKYGVEIVGSIKELLQKVDVVLLETNDGRPHLSQALEVIKAGKPLFVDKPVAGTLAEVVALYAAARKYGVPVFSASSLRYLNGMTDIAAGKTVGKVLGADAFSPAPLEPHHPDFFWYGIHGVETLITAMGSGCSWVSRVSTDGTDVVTGVWSDGRIGTFRGTRTGEHEYGATVFGEKGVVRVGPYSGYEALLSEIAKFFKTGIPPVSEEETLSVYVFMEAADESKRQGGARIALEGILAKARKEAGDINI